MTELNTVYILADRGSEFIFHWVMLMISGLLDLYDLPKPILIHTQNHLALQKETLDLLSPEFEFVEDIQDRPTKVIPGAPLIGSDLLDKKYYEFIRRIILEKNRLGLEEDPKRLLYISRNESHTLSCNLGKIKKRQLLNEDTVYRMLESLGFEKLCLEPLTLKEKIKVFQEAKVIITPNGGALTIAAFAHPKTHVIELHDDRSTGEDQYYNICKNLDISVVRYTNVKCFDNCLKESQPIPFGEYCLSIPGIQDFEVFVTNQLESREKNSFQ